MRLTKKQAQHELNTIFSAIDNQTVVPGTEEYARKQARYMAQIVRIKKQQVYRLPSGVAVRVIRYEADTQRFLCTDLFDNRRRYHYGADLINGQYLGYRYKTKREIAQAKAPESHKSVFLLKHSEIH